MAILAALYLASFEKIERFQLCLYRRVFRHTGYHGKNVFADSLHNLIYDFSLVELLVVTGAYFQALCIAISSAACASCFFGGLLTS